MKNLIKAFGLVVGLLAFGSASAAAIVSNIDHGGIEVEKGNPLFYRHDFTGLFTPGSASNATLDLYLYDNDRKNEIVRVRIQDIGSDGIVLDHNNYGAWVENFQKTLGGDALDLLNSQGYLDLKIGAGKPAKGLDSFFVGQSVLTVYVPEPAILGLMGIGLVGLGFARRRRELED